jgi:hypothetical protein
MDAQARQTSAYYIRQKMRGRQFASALTVHRVGLDVVGADQFGGKYLSGAMFVQSEIDGLPWVALTSGTTGGKPLNGNDTINDGGVLWLQWSGKILAAPPTP